MLIFLRHCNLLSFKVGHKNFNLSLSHSGKKSLTKFLGLGCDLDRYQNLLTCFFYHPGPLYKISSQSVHDCLSNVANRQSDKLTNKPLLQKNNVLCGGNTRCVYQVINHWRIASCFFCNRLCIPP